MTEPRPQVRSLPATLAERRPQLAERLSGPSTPTEAMHAVRDALEELQVVALSERSTRERQVTERALRIVQDAAGWLQAVQAEPRWSSPGGVARRPVRPWRTLGLVALQVVLGVLLVSLLLGVVQRAPAGADQSVTLGVVLACVLVALQTFTGYRLLTAGRLAAPASERPEITLRVDGDRLLSTLSQALVAVDHVEQLAAAPEPEAAHQDRGLAEYPELLRAIQNVYAACLAGNPERALNRGEGLRTSLEQYGVEVVTEWTGDDAPPSDLFVTQRSASPDVSRYRVILPAFLADGEVLLPGRVAAPSERAGARADG
jgi:hypothetical protein